MTPNHDPVFDLDDIDETVDAATAEKIEAAAQMLVDQYGQAALVIASVNADEMVERRDQQGIATWLLIRAAVRRHVNGARSEYLSS